MSKPNWKRRGLSRPITEAEHQQNRRKALLERKIQQLPEFLRETARRNPGLLH